MSDPAMWICPHGKETAELCYACADESLESRGNEMTDAEKLAIARAAILKMAAMPRSLLAQRKIALEALAATDIRVPMVKP